MKYAVSGGISFAGRKCGTPHSGYLTGNNNACQAGELWIHSISTAVEKRVLQVKRYFTAPERATRAHGGRQEEAGDSDAEATWREHAQSDTQPHL